MTRRSGTETLRRLHRVERLESRRLFAVLHNSVNQYDVDASGYVAPFDALVVINALWARQHETPEAVGDIGLREGFFYDVNGDTELSPIDALQVINVLNRGRGALDLSFSVAPDSDPNGNDIVQNSLVDFRGEVSRKAKLRLTVQALDQELEEINDSTVSLEKHADHAGSFEFSPTLFWGRNLVELTATDIFGKQAKVSREVIFGDHVADWNAAALNVIRDWTTTSNDPYEGRIVPSAPPIVSKNLAMIHLAMFDSLNSFANEYTSYLTLESPDPEASPIAASVAAAFEVASTLYPAPRELAVWTATLAESLAQVESGADRENGIAFGKQVAAQLLDARAGDGSVQHSVYSSGTLPGDWTRTGPDFLPPLLPYWGSVKPFAVDSVVPFRPEPPPALDSAAYAAAVDEVMKLGRVDSTERTSDQSEIAVFWADGGGTATPPGHWNRIATDLSVAENQSTLERARTLALLNIALADAGIAAWDAKYAYDLWRPVDAIRNAIDDNNEATVPDSTWQPLLPTPPFPTYTSGHSSFSGAGASVLESVFGDSVNFADRIDSHTGLTQRPLATITTRHFDSLWEAAEEAGASRIYGGIHFSFDNTAGLESGASIGQYVAANWLTPIA